MKKKLNIDTESSFYDINNMASMSECTGLIPSAVEDESEADAYGELYSIHEQKPTDKDQKGSPVT